MRKIQLVVLFAFALLQVLAQKQSAVAVSNAEELMPAGVSVTTTRHSVTIGGKKIDYSAYTGYLNLQNDTGKMIAKVFFTYYKKEGEDAGKRPVTFTFNGGPGSSSVWLHMGGLGPKRVLLKDDGAASGPPYQYINNEYSWLDKTDLVFIDPVSTGYSRSAPGENPKQFHGYLEDISSMGSFVRHFLSRYERWGSPKYLAGESYGTTRAAGLSKYLQDRHRIYLNGIFLISSVLNFGTNDYYVGNDLPRALYIPSYTAAAWYHKKLAADLQSKDLTAYLPEVEAFTINELIPAIAQGGALNAEKKKEIVKKVARYTGIGETEVAQLSLTIPFDYFWKELLRDKGKTVGRLDSRYIGMDKLDAGDSPDYNAELTSWEHSFTPAINMYLRDELGYKTDLEYYIFGPTHPWDNTNNHTGDDLRQAMMQNPYLHLLVQSGYYDGACDYFNAKYNMWQMDPAGKIQDRMFWEGYRSGHMMYLRKEDLATSNDHLRAFIKKSIPKLGTPAKF